MSKAMIQTLRQATEDLIAELGYELADIRFAQEADAESWVLTLFIYHPDGITIDDCEKVSRAVDPIIEEIDPCEEPYFLSVSSLGIDRPFHVTRDFERYLDRDIEVKLYAPIELDEVDDSFEKTKKKKPRAKKKEFIGALRDVDDESITLEIDGQLQVFLREKIAKACPSIQW